MSFREKPWYPVIYMFVITAFFSIILIGLSRFTRARVEANQQVSFERAILEALPLDVSKKTSSTEVHRLFQERISPPEPGSDGAYELREKGRVVAYALPVAGQGFWDEIKGVIGIEADRKTVTGISFYEQHETPGLGAEITQPQFRSQFPGRVIAPSGTPIGILQTGATLGPNDVHAVTGATQTSTRLEKILTQALTPWRAGGNGGER